MFVDRGGQFRTLRNSLEGSLERLGINFEPLRETALLSCLNSRLDAKLTLRFFRDLDHIAGTNLVRRDIDALAVHQNTVVTHSLTRFSAGATKAHAIGDVVQTRLEVL